MEKRKAGAVKSVDKWNEVGLVKKSGRLGRLRGRTNWVWTAFMTVIFTTVICTITMVGSVQAAAEETVVSDTEQFIRWHSARSNDSGESFVLDDIPTSVIEAMDGSYVVAGYSRWNSNANLTAHGYLTKFNANG